MQLKNDKNQLFDFLLGRVEEMVEQSTNIEKTLLAICNLLKDHCTHYDWVGFYLVDQSSKSELVLGPFVGEPTEHVRIPFGKGVCGQAAARKESLIIQDVSTETNYLACSPKVKAEAVMPIIKAGKIVGELDIDSHRCSAFTSKDEKFLNQVCKSISKLF
ncbi:GAF domain-containing protein [Candidatus Acetothermia bacterium]|nr:GAF domain-containing protein [Candidatus Acetothermia bacterium]